jgi:beta-glucanase (GH16 family)
MELVGHQPSTTHGTAHWGPQGQSFSNNHGGDFSLTGSAKFSDEFNVFSIIWTPGRIEYLVNDNRYFTLNQSDVSINYPFDLEFFFIFNVAVGGNWPGNPDNTTQFPQRMVVDYIRVFQ